MSTVSHLWYLMQQPGFRPVLDLATQLTPAQRNILARAACVFWNERPAPWQPWIGRQTAIALGLCCSDYALLEPVPDYLGAFRLTQLGTVITAMWLFDAYEEEEDASWL